jgi:hypothetical protein
MIGMKTYLCEIKRKTAATHVNGYRGAEYGTKDPNNMQFWEFRVSLPFHLQIV